MGNARIGGKWENEEGGAQDIVLISFSLLLLAKCVVLQKEIQALKQQLGMRSPRLGQRQT